MPHFFRKRHRNLGTHWSSCILENMRPSDWRWR